MACRTPIDAGARPHENQRNPDPTGDGREGLDMTLMTDNGVTVSNLVHGQHILAAVSKLHSTETDGVDVWEAEGGHLAPTSPPTGRDLHMRASAG